VLKTLFRSFRRFFTRRKSRTIRRRLPRPNNYLLSMDCLEVRLMPSIAPLLPRPLGNVEHIAVVNTDQGNVGNPAATMNPLTAFQAGGATVTGTATETASGNYNLSITINGAIAHTQNTFVFTATGTVDFQTSQSSVLDGGDWELTDADLSQSTDLTFSWKELDPHGNVVDGVNGDDPMALHDSFSAPDDHWFFLNWTGIVGQVDADFALGMLNNSWTSVSVSEAGHDTTSYNESDTYTLTGAATGSGTIDVSRTGSSNFNLGESGTYDAGRDTLLMSDVTYDESGGQNYTTTFQGSSSRTGSGAADFDMYGVVDIAGDSAYTVTETYNSTDTGTTSYTLGEHSGAFDGDAFTFDKVDLTETTTTQSTAHMSGDTTRTGTVSGSLDVLGNGLGGNYTYTRDDHFSLDRSTTGTTSFTASGSFDGAAFNYNSVGFHQADSGAFTATTTGSETRQGSISGGAGGSVAGLTGSASQNSTVGFNYTVGSTLSEVYDASGSFLNNQLTLTAVSYDQTSTNSTTYTENTTSTWNGTLNGSAGIIGVSLSADLSAGGTDHSNETRRQHNTSHLHQGGTLAAGVLSLSSVVYDQNGTNSYTEHQDSTSTYSGDVTGTLDIGGSGIAEFTLNGESNSNVDANGSGNQTLHYGGSYLNGQLNLSSVTYDDSSSSSVTEHDDTSYTWTGDLSGDFGFSNVISGGLNGEFTANGGEQSDTDQQGTLSAQRHERGTFVNGQLNLSCVTFDQETASTFTQSSSGSFNYDGTISGNLDVLGAAGISGSFSAQGNSSYNSSGGGNSSSTLHQAGTYANGQMTLPCMVYDQGDAGSYTSHSENTSSFNGSASGSLDVMAVGLSGEFTMSGGETSTHDEEGNGTDHTHQEGSYANGATSLSCTVTDQDSHSSTTDHSETTSSSSGDVSGFIDLLGNGMNGEYSSSSSETTILDIEGTTDSDSHEAGTYANGQTSLTCIVMNDSSHQSSTGHREKESSYTATLGGNLDLGFGNINGNFTVEGTESSVIDDEGESDDSTYRAGSMTNGQLNLSSVVFDSSSSDSVTAHDDKTFNYSGTVSGGLGGGNAGLSGTFNASGGETLSYDEEGTDDTTQHQAGTQNGQTLNLSCIVLDQDTNTSYTAHKSNESSYDGHLSGTLMVAGNGITGNLNVEGGSSATLDEDGEKTHSVHQEGTKNGDALNLSCVVLDDTSDSSYTTDSETSWSFDGHVTGNIGGPSIGLSGSFDASQDDSTTYHSEGTASDSRHQAGTFQNNTLNLSCVVHDASQDSSYTLHEEGSSEMSGTGSGIITVLGNGISGTYSADSGDEYSYDEEGTDSKTVHEAGSKSGDTLSLTSVVMTDESSNSFTQHRDGHSSWNGSISGTLNVLGNGVSGNYSGGGADTFSYDEEGTGDSTQYMAGTATGPNYNFSCVVFDEDTTSSVTQDDDSVSTYSGWFSGSLGIGGNGITGSYTADGQDSSSIHKESDVSSTVHQAGTSNGGRLSLSCVVFDQDSSDSFTSEQDGDAHWSGSISGNLGGNSIGLSGSYTLSGNSSYSSQGEGSSTNELHEEGVFSNGSMSISCIVYDNQQDASYTLHRDGDSTYSGTVQGSLVVLGNGLTGSFTADGSESHSHDETGTTSSTLHQQGRYVNGELHLGSVSLDETDTNSFTNHQNGHSSYSGSVQGSIGNSSSFGVSGSYTASGNDSFSYDDQGDSTLTTHQAGRSDVGVLNLTSVVFDSDSSASFTEHRTGGSSYSGSFQGSVYIGGIGLGGSFTASGANSYSHDQQGSSHDTEYEAGTYANNALNLSSVVFDETTSSNVTHHLTGNTHYSGTIQGSIMVLGNGVAGTYTVSGDATWTSDENDTGTTVVHEEGSANNGVLSLTSVVYDTNSTSHYTTTKSDHSTWNGTIGGGISIGIGGLSGTYTVSGTEDSTHSETGSTNDTLHEEGTYANGSFNLSSITYDYMALNSYSNHKTGSTNFSGDLTGSLNVGVGSVSGNYHVDGNESWTFDESGANQKAQHMEGVYSNGSMSLSCVAYDEGNNNSFTYHGSGGSNWNGSFGGSLNLWLGSVGGSYSFSGHETHTYDETGRHTDQLHEAGTYAGGVFTMTEVSYDQVDQGTMVSVESGSRTKSITVSGSVLGIEDSETFTSTEPYTNTDRSSTNSHIHQGGSYANGDFHLATVTNTVSSTDSFTHHTSDVYSWSDDSSSGTETYVFDESGSVTRTTVETGHYENAQFTLDSVTYDETGTYNTTTTHQGSSTWTEEDNTDSDYLGWQQFNTDGTTSYTSVDSASVSYSIHAQGSYANGHFSFPCFTRDEVSRHTTTYSETGSYEDTGTGSNGIANYDYHANESYSYQSIYDFKSQLHEEGTAQDAQVSINCMVYDEQSQDSYVYDHSKEETASGDNYDGSYGFDRHEEDAINYTLHETGSNTAPVSLNCYVYDGTAGHTITVNEHGSQSYTQDNGNSTTDNQHSFTDDSDDTEMSTLHEAGTYANGSFNLSCYVHDDKTHSGATTTHDDLVSSTYDNGGGNTGSSMSHDVEEETSLDDTSLHEAGTMTGGNFHLSCYVYDQETASTHSLTSEDQSDTQYSYGNTTGGSTHSVTRHEYHSDDVTDHAAGTAENLNLSLTCYTHDESSTDSFTQQTEDTSFSTDDTTDSSSTTTVDESGSTTSDLHEEGTYLEQQWNLSCHVYNRDSTQTQITHQTSVSSSTWSDWYGEDRTYDSNSDTEDSVVTTSQLHTEGRYSYNSGLSLSCYSYDEGVTETHTDSDSWSSTTDYSDANGDSSSTDSHSHDQTQTSSTGLHEGGTYSDAAGYNFTSYSYDESATDSWTDHDESDDTSSYDYGSSSNDSTSTYTRDDSYQSSSDLHEAGSYTGGQFDIGDYSYDGSSQQTTHIVSTSTNSSSSNYGGTTGSSTSHSSNDDTWTDQDELHAEGSYTSQNGLSLSDYTSDQSAGHSYTAHNDDHESSSGNGSSSDSSSHRDETGATTSHVHGEGSYDQASGLTLDDYTYDTTDQSQYTYHSDSHSSSHSSWQGGSSDSASTSTHDENGDHDATMHMEGTYAGGNFDITNYTYDETSDFHSTDDSTGTSSSSSSSGGGIIGVGGGGITPVGGGTISPVGGGTITPVGGGDIMPANPPIGVDPIGDGGSSSNSSSSYHNHSTSSRTTNLHESGSGTNWIDHLDDYSYDETTDNASTSSSNSSSSSSGGGSSSSSSSHGTSESDYSTDTHAQGTYDAYNGGLALDDYSYSSDSSSAGTYHEQSQSSGNGYSSSWSHDTNSSNDDSFSVEGSTSGYSNQLNISSYEEDNSGSWDSYSSWSSSGGGMSSSGSGHDWSDSHYHASGSGTTAHWTDDTSGGYSYSSNPGGSSSDSWSNHSEGDMTIGWSVYNLPLVLHSAAYTFAIPGVATPLHFETPGVAMYLPGVALPTSTGGVYIPNPVDLENLIPLATNRNAIEQNIPASDAGLNDYGIHGGSKAARAANDFAARIDAGLSNGPRVPLNTSESIRSARLNDQFALLQAQSTIGTLAPPTDEFDEMWKAFKQGVRDGGVMFLNGATFGTIKPLSEEANRLKGEYGDTTFWVCNIAGGVAAVAVITVGAILTEGALLEVMGTGALFGAGFAFLRQVAVNIDKHGFRDYDQWEFDWQEVAAGAVIGAYLAPLFMIPVVGEILMGGFMIMGAYSAYTEYQQGHYWTAAFDLVTALLPLKDMARSGGHGVPERPTVPRVVPEGGTPRLPGTGAGRAPVGEPNLPSGLGPRRGVPEAVPGENPSAARCRNLREGCFVAGTLVVMAGDEDEAVAATTPPAAGDDWFALDHALAVGALVVGLAGWHFSRRQKGHGEDQGVQEVRALPARGKRRAAPWEDEEFDPWGDVTDERLRGRVALPSR
jgi:hypothetical protein